MRGCPAARAGVVPTIDVADSAASSAVGGAASQELSADESPLALQKHSSFASSQDLVRRPHTLQEA